MLDTLQDDHKQLTPVLPSHYIGIGASAGGLEALQQLLQNLPRSTGASFIIVQHLSPDFKSMMQELLSKHTAMSVNNVTDSMRIEPNTIYLIPPKKNMIVAQGLLMLSDKVPDSGLSLPIDIFFRSLAEDQQHKAIGIILSGTGSDGSRGIKALKEAGGLVIAQDPASAKFDGMPNSAINTGVIDLILPPEEMGLQLESYIRHPLVSGDIELLKENIQGNADIMAEIFNVLRTKSEIDFAKYKPSTVARRIERRMTIKQLTTLHEYLTLLFKDPHETEILSKELLIGVTRFFRDDDAFNLLKNDIIPQVISQSEEGDTIRVWSAACSTGEEAYSLGILFADELKKQGLKRTIKVFATDVNSDSVSSASNGIYREDIEHDIDPKILSTYFIRTPDGSFQVDKAIRQTVIFATHNMIVDPPFSNMDLVVCRNILIYFQHAIQKKVLASLHFALRNSGHLFLGSSESLGDLAPYFEVINERNRMYRKRDNSRIPMNAVQHTMAPTAHVDTQPIPSVTRLMKNYRGVNTNASAIGFANQSLITRYAPPCILLNEHHEALHVYGDVTRFIRRLPPGRISTNVNDLVNEDICIAVTSALHRASSSGEEVYYTGVNTLFDGESIALSLRVSYLKEHDMETSPGFYWLVFEEENATSDKKFVKSVSFDVSEQSRQRIEDLEFELTKNKERLQVTIEELETTNEELQSSNEELMSANEELQSTNEELQSVNEELYTVNSEYQEKISEISQTTNDLDEVLNLSKIGIIFLDEAMSVRRYTNAVAQYVNLRHTDVGRPLHHISKNIEYDNMLPDVAQVFATGESIENEVATNDHRVLKISIHSYSYADTSQNTGVAITFSDITQVIYSEKGMSVAYSELHRSINNAIEVLDTSEFQSAINVLIVDDQAADQKVLGFELNKISDFEITPFIAENIASAKAIAKSEAIDVCLVDYYLDNETAIDLVNEFSKHQIDIPMIVLTAAVDNSLNALLLSHGILDLLDKKDANAVLLSRCIRYAIRRRQINDQIEKVMGSARTIKLPHIE